MSEQENIKVALRQRPLSTNEKRECSKKVFEIDESSGTIFCTVNRQKFTYDYVFNDFSENFMIYDCLVEKKLKKAFDGYNATILAYGQTGSGKTYTMGLESFEDICSVWEWPTFSRRLMVYKSYFL